MSLSPFSSSSTQARLAVRFSLLALVFGSATSVMLQGPSTPLPAAVVQVKHVQHVQTLEPGQQLARESETAQLAQVQRTQPEPNTPTAPQAEGMSLQPEEKRQLTIDKVEKSLKKRFEKLLDKKAKLHRSATAKLTLEHYTRCVARELDVDEGLAVSVLIQESDANNPMRRGKRGSRGPLQIQPIALEEVGLSRHERSLPILVYGGLRYLKTMMMRFDTLDTALAAYNMGPTSLVRRDYRPYRVTRRYVQQILNRAGKIRSGDVPSYPVLQYPLSKRDLPAKHHQLAPLQACLV